MFVYVYENIVGSKIQVFVSFTERLQFFIMLDLLTLTSVTKPNFTINKTFSIDEDKNKQKL